MTLTLYKVTELIKSEYHNLCKALSLQQVDLDIYIVQPDSTQSSQFGTPFKNATAAYKPGLLVLPLCNGDFGVIHEQSPVFPPTTWRKNDPVEWPVWRIELWHEVCHQIVDQVFHAWSLKNQHGESWRKAIDFVAKYFDVEFKDIDGVL